MAKGLGGLALAIGVVVLVNLIIMLVQGRI